MLNQVILIGRICNDLELKQSSGGKSFLRFTLACDRGKDKGTDFVDCTAFNATAENTAKYQGKGSLVGVVGSINVNTVEKDGQKRKYTGVNANRVVFLQSKNQNSANSSQNPADGFAQDVSFDPDDVPF